jgi:hypothetical protein
MTGTFTVVDANGNPLVDVARGSYVAMNGVLGVTSDAFDNNGSFPPEPPIPPGGHHRWAE